jgi:hypothetical protein
MGDGEAKGERIMECLDNLDAEVEWRCSSCRRTFYGNCVKMFGDGNARAAVCPVCSERCDEIITPEQAAATCEPSFWERLPGVFAYPLKKDGPFILVAGAVFFTLAEFVIGISFLMGVALSVFIAGYLCRFYLSVLFKSAQGRPHPPTWPDFDPQGFFSEGVEAICKVVGPAIVSYLPAIAYLLFGPREFNAVFVLLFALGCLYYPMALTAIAITDDFAALNPVLVFRCMLRVPSHYLATAIIFLVLVSLNYLRELYLGIHVFAVGALVSWLILLYFWTMTMHLLGVFYHSNRRKLRWI